MVYDRDHWIAVGERIAGLRIELHRARHRRAQLDLPLFIQTANEPRKERHATSEEVRQWQAEADARIADIEQKIEAELEPPSDDWSDAELPADHQIFSGMVTTPHPPTGLPVSVRAATDRESRLMQIRGLAKHYGADTIRSILNYLDKSAASTPTAPVIPPRSCKVCRVVAQDGVISHSKACYQYSAEGGGDEDVD